MTAQPTTCRVLVKVNGERWGDFEASACGMVTMATVRVDPVRRMLVVHVHAAVESPPAYVAPVNLPLPSTWLGQSLSLEIEP